MPQITKSDYDWLRSHKEYIIRQKRYERYLATFLIWLGISIGNYYFLASFSTIIWSVEILLFEFEILLLIGTIYVLLTLNHKKLSFDDSITRVCAVAIDDVVAFGLGLSLVFATMIVFVLTLTLASVFALTIILALTLADSEEE